MTTRRIRAPKLNEGPYSRALQEQSVVLDDWDTTDRFFENEERQPRRLELTRCRDVFDDGGWDYDLDEGGMNGGLDDGGLRMHDGMHDGSHDGGLKDGMLDDGANVGMVDDGAMNDGDEAVARSPLDVKGEGGMNDEDESIATSPGPSKDPVQDPVPSEPSPEEVDVASSHELPACSQELPLQDDHVPTSGSEDSASVASEPPSESETSSSSKLPAEDIAPQPGLTSDIETPRAASPEPPNEKGQASQKEENEEDSVVLPSTQREDLDVRKDLDVVLVFPPVGLGKVTISSADAERLKPGGFLNDSLVEFGLKLWLKTLADTSPLLAKQVHVFSSFFYKKLTTYDVEAGYKSVQRWTSKVDLFEKKYIIVPINEDLHWYLGVIYNSQHAVLPSPAAKPGRKQREEYQPNRTHVLVMDSMGTRRPQVCKRLASYLQLEAREKKGVARCAEIISRQLNVPTQPNFSDCGLYVLHFAEMFVKDASNLLQKDFSMPRRSPNSERQEAWNDGAVHTMREKLSCRLKALSDEWLLSVNVQEGVSAGDYSSDSDLDIGPVTRTKPPISSVDSSDSEIEIGPVTGSQVIHVVDP